MNVPREQMEELEPFPENELFAQIDILRIVQDYPPHRLGVRLIGVSPDSFAKTAFNSEGGCPTYIIDLSWADFHWKSFSWLPMLLRQH